MVIRRVFACAVLMTILVFGVAGLARADSILYATGTRVGPGTGPGGLYQIDPVTGFSVLLFELDGFVHGGGLAYDAATDLLYATGYDITSQSGLWTIDRFTGNQTFVGYTGAALDQWGLAIDPVTGVMYATGDDAKQSTALYTVDKTTGAATFVGQATGQFTRLYGLGFGSGGVLYANGFGSPDFSSPPSLFTVNPATGGSGLVGPTGVTLGRATSYSGLALRADGTLLTLGSIDAGTGGLYALNASTGVATLLGATNLTFGVDGGLAFAPDRPSDVPEPASLVLSGLGLTALAAWRRRASRIGNLR